MSSTGLPNLLWRKSSYSNGQANCVEAAAAGDRQTSVRVRDSKAPDAPGLVFTARVWRQFTDSVKSRSTQAGLNHNLRRELSAGPFRAHALASTGSSTDPGSTGPTGGTGRPDDATISIAPAKPIGAGTPTQRQP